MLIMNMAREHPKDCGKLICYVDILVSICEVSFIFLVNTLSFPQSSVQFIFSTLTLSEDWKGVGGGKVVERRRKGRGGTMIGV